MMNLSPTQIDALEHGEAVSFAVGDREYVIVSRASYEREKNAATEALDPDTLYRLMEVAMQDDDANDPGLESYQKYR